MKNSVAYVTTRRDHGQALLPRTSELGVDRLMDLHVVAQGAEPLKDQLSALRRKAYSFLGLTEHTEVFQVGDIFELLNADLKQPRFFGSL